MTSPPGGKSYVDRAEIFSNEKLAPEVRAILVCIEKIDAKILPLVVWLIASGETGLNTTELKELTGFGLETVNSSVQRLIDLGFVKSIPSLLQSESGRFTIVPELGEPPSVTELVREGKTGGIFFKTSKITLSSSESLISLNKRDPLATLAQKVGKSPVKRKIKRKKLKVQPGKQTGKTKSLSDITREIKPDHKPDHKMPQIEKKSENDSKLGAPNNHQKTKKINGSPTINGIVTTNGRTEFADDLRSESKRRYGKPRNYGAHVNEPSKNPALTQWKTKHQPNRWRGPDWVGYWLYKWREFYEQEDPLFAGQRFIKSAKRSRERGSGRVDVYWETAFKIEAFRDNDRAFRGDGEGLKQYFDWLFDTFLPDADWLDTPLTASQIFRTRNNTFLERFKVRSVKVKKTKNKKGKGKWRHWGWDSEG